MRRCACDAHGRLAGDSRECLVGSDRDSAIEAVEMAMWWFRPYSPSGHPEALATQYRPSVDPAPKPRVVQYHGGNRYRVEFPIRLHFFLSFSSDLAFFQGNVGAVSRRAFFRRQLQLARSIEMAVCRPGSYIHRFEDLFSAGVTEECGGKVSRGLATPGGWSRVSARHAAIGLDVGYAPSAVRTVRSSNCRCCPIRTANSFRAARSRRSMTSAIPTKSWSGDAISIKAAWRLSGAGNKGVPTRSQNEPAQRHPTWSPLIRRRPCAKRTSDCARRSRT